MILRRPHASGPDRYGLAGLLPVIRMRDIDVTLITLGTDLTTLGVNLTSSDVLYATFAYPCAETPMSHEPKYVVPRCYQQHSAMIFKQQNIHKIQLETLFYIFYSMPNDIMQALAAREMYVMMMVVVMVMMMVCCKYLCVLTDFADVHAYIHRKPSLVMHVIGDIIKYCTYGWFVFL